MIEIIGTELYQWDTGRSVRVESVGATHVHLANQGDSQAPIIELKDGQAKIPDYLLQTGKQLCAYAVANGVTIAKKTFSVKKRERPENYVYDEDQRNFIYELIASAKTATEAANQAAEKAIDSIPVRGEDYWTDADKAEIVKEAKEAAIGDIETALDSIIAIQEELINGGGAEETCPGCGEVLNEDGSCPNGGPDCP